MLSTFFVCFWNFRFWLIPNNSLLSFDRFHWHFWCSWQLVRTLSRLDSGREFDNSRVQRLFSPSQKRRAMRSHSLSFSTIVHSQSKTTPKSSSMWMRKSSRISTHSSSSSVNKSLSEDQHSKFKCQLFVPSHVIVPHRLCRLDPKLPRSKRHHQCRQFATTIKSTMMDRSHSATRLPMAHSRRRHAELIALYEEDTATSTQRVRTRRRLMRICTIPKLAIFQHTINYSLYFAMRNISQKFNGVPIKSHTRWRWVISFDKINVTSFILFLKATSVSSPTWAAIHAIQTIPMAATRKTSPKRNSTITRPKTILNVLFHKHVHKLHRVPGPPFQRPHALQPPFSRAILTHKAPHPRRRKTIAFNMHQFHAQPHVPTMLSPPDVRASR